MVEKSKVLMLSKRACKLVLLFIILLSAMESRGQGLQFGSNDSLMSKRTSYQVFKDDLPTFHDHLAIGFDLSLWDNQHLGYILNLTDDKGNSYSLSAIYNHGSFLNFNIDSRSNKLSIPLADTMLKRRKWFKVIVDLDLKGDKVGISINGKWYRAAGLGFNGKITAKITFGKNEHYSDVPNMAIKNLVVSNDDKSYTFLLSEWTGNDVFTVDGDNLGHVDNPAWLINESYFWKQKFVHTFNEVAGINFNEKNEQFFIFKSDSLMFYDAGRDAVETKPFKNKLAVPLHLGKSIVNLKENECYLYEVLRAPQPSPSIASFNLDSLSWDFYGKATITEQRHHHNIFYDKDFNNFYLFGGYGSFKYYNNFFKYDKAADTWQQQSFTGDVINPRFFSAASTANQNNDVYIFGGYGNQSGNQVVGGMHYYDLYRINLDKHSIKKLWEIKPDEEAFVPANNLIVSKDKQFFYVLCYPHERPKTSLRLYKFSIKDGSYQVVSGTIPVVSERIETDHNLFYNAKQDVFYCTTQEFETPSRSTIKIFALTAPPVSQEAFVVAHQPKSKSFTLYRILGGASAFVLLCGIVMFFLRRRKDNDEPVTVKEERIAEQKIETEMGNKANAVYLLGEFTVYDKNKRDITYLFSPKIKQLFILILLNSREKNGVVSKKISTTLWPDKDVVKTKNIRGVTINHLRNILSDIDGLELAFLNDTYSFISTEDFYCDYFVVREALKQTNVSEAVVFSYLDLVARGGLLQHIPEIWLDDFKQEYEEALMPAILPVIKKAYDAFDYKKALEIARIVLNIDPFNDIGIKFKLKALRRTKGIEHARKVYEEFSAEYEKSLGEEYPVPFEKICSNKSDPR
ncbi:two-component SAPR family response regulator [Mucilaginibacter rubeus]|uniref:Kelch repeat-containing protein n=1 Tax=Mucilaginibacter rubeus TaxID=2027860 RepID=UPI003397B33F